MRRLTLALHNALYNVARPVLFRQSAQEAHESLLRLLAQIDDDKRTLHLLKRLHQLTTVNHLLPIGGTILDYPLILAAGFVKGHGFASEINALNAVAKGENIIPGWRSVPTLVGIVEFGSFTRHPRLGNEGTTLWRHPASKSLQNRIGLKNPGVAAASEFLRQRKLDLQPIFGINIAVTPHQNDPYIQIDETLLGIHSFIDKGVIPSWFTLNLSCPNTDEDPHGNQTEQLAQALCSAITKELAQSAHKVPLWVKVSPDLADNQLRILMSVFAETGVCAVIATNTLAQPTPDNLSVQAGMSGSNLFTHGLRTARTLQQARFNLAAPVDVIACGGVMDGKTLLAYKALGISVAQCWSAFIYRGPLALQVIESEAND